MIPKKTESMIHIKLESRILIRRAYYDSYKRGISDSCRKGIYVILMKRENDTYKRGT